MPATSPPKLTDVVTRNMRIFARIFVLTTIMGAGWSPLAQAETLIFGVGHTRFSDDNADDFPIFSLELQRDPFKSVGGWDFGLGGAVSIDTNGDGHLGLGLYAIYHTKSQWFFETSVMPGVYFNGSSDNWLGGHFQIRSLLALGYDLNAPNSISLAVTHISNASTRDFNPGVNALWLRWHLRF